MNMKIGVWTHGQTEATGNTSQRRQPALIDNKECIVVNQSSAIIRLPQSQNNDVDYFIVESYTGNPVQYMNV